jgi:hypothetical protein
LRSTRHGHVESRMRGNAQVRFGGRARETDRAEKPALRPGPTLRYRPAERRWAWRSDLVPCADVESARFYGRRRHRSAPCRRHPRYKSLKLPLRSWGQRNRKFRIVRALNNLGYSERLAYNVVSLERFHLLPDEARSAYQPRGPHGTSVVAGPPPCDRRNLPSRRYAGHGGYDEA